MTKWLNTKHIIAPKTEKPCHKLGWCPYGQLVEEFPLKVKKTALSCGIFGHDCPAFYHREDFREEHSLEEKMK